MSAPPRGREAERQAADRDGEEPDEARRGRCRGRRRRRRSRSRALDVAERLARALDVRAARRRCAGGRRGRRSSGRERDLLAAADELEERDAAAVRLRELLERLSVDLAVRHDGVERPSTGKSRSSRSSTSTPKAKISSKGERGGGPRWRRRRRPRGRSPLHLLRKSPSRRIRLTKTRSGAKDFSNSPTVLPPRARRQLVGPHVPLAVRGLDALLALAVAARERRLELLRLLLEVHLQELRREAGEEPHDEARADEIADRVGHRDAGRGAASSRRRRSGGG